MLIAIEVLKINTKSTRMKAKGNSTDGQVDSMPSVNDGIAKGKSLSASGPTARMVSISDLLLVSNGYFVMPIMSTTLQRLVGSVPSGFPFPTHIAICEVASGDVAAEGSVPSRFLRPARGGRELRTRDRNFTVLARRPHARLRALLLPHRRKSSCLDESHDITSHAAVSMLLCQRVLPLRLPVVDYLLPCGQASHSFGHFFKPNMSAVR